MVHDQAPGGLIDGSRAIPEGKREQVVAPDLIVTGSGYLDGGCGPELRSIRIHPSPVVWAVIGLLGERVGQLGLDADGDARAIGALVVDKGIKRGSVIEVVD